LMKTFSMFNPVAFAASLLNIRSFVTKNIALFLHLSTVKNNGLNDKIFTGDL
jgi:hypothetical protein